MEANEQPRFDPLTERVVRVEDKVDLAISRLDRIDLNGQTRDLKELAKSASGLILVAQALPPLIPDLQDIVSRHRDHKGFVRTLSRVTAWGMTRDVLVFVIGGGLASFLTYSFLH